jgi:hypothetical protein
MKKPIEYNGNIDLFKDGMIYGWAVTAELFEKNSCDLFIDQQYITTFLADLYREDLKAEQLRDGIAGFTTVVPARLCDNKSHLVEIFKHATDIKLHTKHLVLHDSPTFNYLQEMIVFNYRNHLYDAQKPIVLLAGFSNQKQLLNHQKHLIKSFQKAGLYVVYIIASDTPEQLSTELTVADRVIVRRNINYDFGSWATAWICCHKELYSAKNIFFVNDSIIGPIHNIKPLLKMIANIKTDIWAITASQAERYHFQSYFWGIKKIPDNFAPIIDEFFFYRHPLPKDKEEAINLYELAALAFFVDRRLTIEILFPEHMLINTAEIEFLNALDSHLKKWGKFFDLPLKDELFSQVQGGLVNYADTMMNRLTTNHAHIFWNVLIK